jgi:hypothetical protein
MKLGAEKKKQVAIMAALVVVALLLIFRDVINLGGSRGATMTTAVTRNVRSTATDPRLHLDELERVQSIHYQGSLRNLFEPAAEQPGPRNTAGPGAPGAPGGPLPNTPPPTIGSVGPPPLPLKFYGFETRRGEAKRVFLQMGDNVYVVTEGQIIEHRYLIGRIEKTTVEVRDLQTQQAQTLPLIVAG